MIDNGCDKCGGTGWAIIEGTNDSVACACQKEMKTSSRLALAGIPRRYEQCSLSTFEALSPTLQRARDETQEFVDHWPNVDRGLLFMGNCGTGKTHLAVAALREVIRKGVPGRYVFRNFQDLVQELQASFESDGGPTKNELMRPLIEADLLVLDELGSQKPTQFVQDILYYVINSRYNEDRTTIFTTNYFDSPEESSEASLSDRIGARLRSRLYEMARPIVITEPEDYRKRKSRMI